MTSKRRYSVLSVLLASFIGTSVFGVGLALYVGLGTAYENTRNLWVMLADIDLTSVQRTMHERMSEVDERSNWVARQVADGNLDPSFQYGWTNAMRALAAADMDVMAYGLVTGDRQFIGFNPDDMSEIRRTLPQDDMLFSELAQIRGPVANRTGFPRWDPYFNRTVLTSWVPLFYDGHYLGTFIQYLSLSNLSESLIRGREDLPGTPFILIGGNRVMAHPDLRDWGENTANKLINGADIARSPIPLPTIHDIGDPVLANIGKSERIRTDEKDARQNTGLRLAGLEVDGRYHLIVTRQVLNAPISPVIIGMHFTEELFDDEWDRLVLASILGGGVFILAVIVAIILSKQFTKPIRRFAAAARAFEDDDIASIDVPQLSGSRIREYDDAARSFNHMMMAVHDRERITSLFGKFVPQSIAKKLLASGNDSGVLPPQQSEATVLFIDIAHFTSMCESLHPNQIIAMLNDYFDCATQIIESHGGIITQFQGDAILAVYNVFDDLEHHADAALDSAIALQNEVSNRTFEGLNIQVRCGVNTGTMVAGNVGAKARLSFTVHGDAVNTASRLEQENKVLGTRILISDSTRNLLTDPNRVIKAGDVLLRGRHSKTELFTTNG
ncbi:MULTISPECIES: adenylate/guanylate cyclase domain-containing protein [Thalassospira]|uniref:Adenylate/guanylate cyclase domain-containing protein n=1 Tax=Thalassospira povalilytica TaxID=732237 RepID=A0A8I1SJX2_9PROT|nr:MULTISPECIES: adenylate/guanylate cyclase domain-containing protein [Thalassospira]MEE3044833.1 adenylate/guanylate cyclase domain-containing protein [Pseudomonadota bacterium]RCK27188.1 guanylate cyclase [Thalassospira profundimaris]HAY48140.1 adenylate/guanylate cyclase domain-containing protein [Thalassospira sp.]KZB60322.1 guanylate cyclase [Thalassospira sp. MCCC 1A02491]MBN8197050.1 adenylate/guanylate cyclase domain-containing protein [Thalassospira povalilytica]